MIIIIFIIICRTSFRKSRDTLSTRNIAYA